MEKSGRVLRALTAVWLLSFSLAAPAADKALVLAVHPYLPPAEIMQRFTPLAEALARQLGRPVSVRVGGDYQQHIEAIGEDRVDIAFLGPASYLSVVERFGPKPLLARFEVNHAPYLYGVIAVRQDATLRDLRELAHQRFAFGDPDSTMGHLVPRYLLLQAGIPRGLPAIHQFLGSHKNVALAVLAGDFTAGAMKQEVFDEYQPRGLRALARTPGVPDHLFVARNTLPAAEVARLREALLQLHRTPDGAAILDKLHAGLTALVPATDGEYDELRAMVRAVEATER